MIRSSKKKLAFQVIMLVVVVTIIFSLSLWISKNQGALDAVANYGYLGALILSIISGFNLVVPIPAASFTPLFLSAGLSLPFLIAVISLGMTIADIIAFFIGRAGRMALKVNSSLPNWAKSNYWNGRSNLWVVVIILLYASFIPLPNELIVIPLALLGYRLLVIAPALLLGNILFNLIASWGFISLYSFIS